MVDIFKYFICIFRLYNLLLNYVTKDVEKRICNNLATLIFPFTLFSYFVM